MKKKKIDCIQKTRVIVDYFQKYLDGSESMISITTEFYHAYLEFAMTVYTTLQQVGEISTYDQVIELHFLIKIYLSMIQILMNLEVNPLDLFQCDDKYTQFTKLPELFSELVKM